MRARDAGLFCDAVGAGLWPAVRHLEQRGRSSDCTICTLTSGTGWDTRIDRASSSGEAAGWSGD